MQRRIECDRILTNPATRYKSEFSRIRLRGAKPNSHEFGYAIQIRTPTNPVMGGKSECSRIRLGLPGSIVVRPRNKNDGSERQENARFLRQSLAVQS